MARKKGLGRGLDILIPKETNTQAEEAKDTSAEAAVKKKEKAKKDDQMININLIEPNRDQPRKQFDEEAIDELADSIKKHGLINPVIVKKNNDYYEIIAGERRWRACKKAGLKKIPVIVREYDDEETLKVSLIENVQREDLNVIEEAKAYERLQKEFGLTQDEIAGSVSKSRTAVTNTMRLLKLDSRVSDMIMDNLLTGGHGRALLVIEDPDLQYNTAMEIVKKNLSVREVERLVKTVIREQEKEKEESDNTTSLPSQSDDMVHFFEERLKEIIGTKVAIKNRKNNKGRIEIDYYSLDELERIIDMIQSIRE